MVKLELKNVKTIKGFTNVNVLRMEVNMKKKILLVIGVAVLTLGLAACSSDKSSSDKNVVKDTSDEKNSSDKDKQKSDSAVAIFDNIWNLYGEDEKFSAMGGSSDNPVDGKPGTYNLEDKEGLSGLYYIPAEQTEAVDDVATLMHMMNANTFTGVVAHVSDTKAFADAVKKNIEGTQWVCGFPDRLIIAEVEKGYIAYAFGEASIMEIYMNKLSEAYSGVNILYDVNLS